ncbi:MAG: cell division protein FtsZ [Holosporaceae bacterium]|jgi:cell division protein FtsZ|nr:cell division protein FtsZ [Rhodospirillaceae bacterium]
MSLNLTVSNPQNELKPRLAVVGVGGGGNNAIDNMIRLDLEGVDFIVANTDAQTLSQSKAPLKIQLGAKRTKGLGAGARPDVGREAAEEAIAEVLDSIQGYDMVFITAGMGGGTGTGAAPVIARAAREQGILTVGVVTKPFHFEGVHRMRLAEAGIDEMQQYVDTLIVVPNQNLFRIANEHTTFMDAFKTADNVLYQGVRGITDLIMMPGMINLDFADIRTVMSEMGKAMMGTGEADGAERAIRAAEAAISNPLLDDVSMRGAKGILIHVSGALDMTLFEADQAANRIREEVDSNANIIFGATFDEKLAGKIRISVVATGIESSSGGSAIGGGGFGNSVVSTLRPAAATAVPNTPVANQAVPSSAPNSSRVYNKGGLRSAESAEEKAAEGWGSAGREPVGREAAGRESAGSAGQEDAARNSAGQERAAAAASTASISSFPSRGGGDNSGQGSFGAAASANTGGAALASAGRSAASSSHQDHDDGWDEILRGNAASASQAGAGQAATSAASHQAFQAAPNQPAVKRGLLPVEDAFIPPVAVEPRGSRLGSVAASSASSSSGLQQEDNAFDRLAHGDDGHAKSLSLFERVASAAFPRLGRGSGGASVEPSLGGGQQGSQGGGEQAGSSSANASSKDLEIPAFLRRQEG